MDLVGKYIGNRYELLEKIGNGGMATVYKAKCHVLNRFVAVKILKDEFTTDAEFIRRFNIEAQAAASLTHPNIVSIYDVAHEDNIYYIVMELVQGKTLKEIITEDGTLPWKWSVNIAIQIASALEMAHKNNIVHRDIKPHNIIITEDGVAKVTDFGIAKAVSNSTITAFGTTIGSVHYFSPEHAKGGFTDAKSDIYSLGIVMYEMLTGRVPFDADTPVSIALKHMQEKPIEAIKLNPSIPFAINQIIMKAMQKEPSLRYGSATEMLKDLSMSLKNPEGKFVKEDSIPETGYTQRMGTITDEMLEEANKAQKKVETKKKGKIATFMKEHPKAKIAIIVFVCILLFVATAFGVKLALDAGTVKDVSLPNLVGKTEEEVKQALAGTKLTYEITAEEYNGDVEAGKVISQNPTYRTNYTIKETTKIGIVVSKGLEKTKMPKVTGLKWEDAEKAILEAKLKVEKIEETSKTVEAGYVTKQEVEENAEINAGDTIKIYVSKGTGIKQVTVNSVVGKTEESAKKELSDAGLKVTVAYEEDSTKSNGIVLKQSLDVGKIVDENTEIVITVNKLAEMKNGTVNVNLKSLINYTGNTNTNTNTTGGTTTPEKVEVKVNVGNDTVYKEKHTKDTTKISIPVSGVGTITIKVYVDDILKTTKTMDLNKTTTIDIE